jgi:hypothetical protein
MSPGELANLEIAKGKLACLLGDCGYAEAARECELRRLGNSAAAAPRHTEVDAIVKAVLEKMKS